MSPSVALFPSIHPSVALHPQPLHLAQHGRAFRSAGGASQAPQSAHMTCSAQQQGVVYLMVSWQVFQILAGNGRVDDERVHADKAFDDGGRARRRLHLPHRRERTRPPSRCSFNGDRRRGFVGGAVFRALRVLLNGMAPAFPFGADALPPQPLRVNLFLQPPSGPPPSVERTSAKPGERNLHYPFVLRIASSAENRGFRSDVRRIRSHRERGGKPMHCSAAERELVPAKMRLRIRIVGPSKMR